MISPGAEALVARVRENCHVADARHAAEMTLCTYLLQMRELFRWEQGLALGTPLAREAVGAWMAEREALWARLAHENYRPLPLPGAGGGLVDPFDVEAVNAALAPRSLLYGAGVVANGLQGRPVFFVADLHGRSRREGLAVLQAGREKARTLLAPPAALGGDGNGPIVLRRESMARWCWERAEAYAMRPRPGSALQAMLAHYGLDRDFQAGLPRWLDDQCETAVWHEIGEYRLSRRWGDRWSELRAAATWPEALVRALRDQLADLGVTLPALLERAEPGPLHAWFAGYEGLREASFPALAAGYRAWRGGDGGKLLGAQQVFGLRHFESLAASLLDGPEADRAAARARFVPGRAGVPPPMVCHWAVEAS